MRQHLVVTSFLDVQNFALERQDRLKAPITALFRGAACGFSFYQKKFAAVGIALRAVGKLSRESSAIESAFATRQITSFASSFTSARRINCLVDDLARHGGIPRDESCPH